MTAAITTTTLTAVGDPCATARRPSTRLPSPLSLGLGLVLLVAGAAGASAQTTVVITNGGGYGYGGYAGYGAFGPAQRDYMAGYVVRHPVPPAPIPGGFVASVGAVVPNGVVLNRFGPPVAYGGYAAGYPQGYGQAAYDDGGYGDAGYVAGGYGAVGPGYGGAYPGGYDFSGYRYVVLPGNEAAVVEARTRRIILIIE
ncbi:hypothetical protein V5F59_11030 [Xanthobacter autotrophicus DSM 431]|uniref:hypothetical protein n=1 Tax=Xanthobacter nonsaccharivorans TaxID=3119912 RepID=UPI00372B8AA0